ncbi:hypothetical protein [Clostridium paraputrificum]|uniref:hypothetical protein n=1 Tax=Clostridium paraputrificum TaxID=29363 RepID=UPI00374F3728
MGNKEVKEIEGLVEEYGKLAISKVMKRTEDDIKVNRIAFGVRTNKKDFMKLFYMNLNKCLRSC